MEGLRVKNVVKNFGDFRAINDISFDISPGEFVTLLGPSGCGKTTLLRMIAGFIDPDQGEIIFNGRLMNNVPPNKRNTAMCFQSYALFPHMTVYENIRFGLRMKKVPEEQQKKRIADVIDIVNLTGLGHRKPYELSGGQQQRVALARAIVVEPDMLLFDEPLSNLDAKLREKVRVEIRELQKKLGITSIYVTHDQAEALAISDQIISIDRGEIIQKSDPVMIYDKPVNRFVADFIGIANIVAGRVVSRDGVNVVAETEIGRIVAADNGVDGDEVDICWRPEDMIPLVHGESGENSNVLTGLSRNVVYMGNIMDVFMEISGKVVRANVIKGLSFADKTELSFCVPYAKMHLMQGGDNAEAKEI